MRLGYLLIFLCLLIYSDSAWALREVYFNKQTTVYYKRSKYSEILTVFEKGEKAPISSRKYGKWRKIIVETNGRRQAGWIMAQDIRRARIREREKPKDYSIYHLNQGVGFLAGLSYWNQGSRSASSTADVATATIDSMSGVSSYFGILADFPISDTMSFRTELLFRTSDRKGEGVFAGNSQVFAFEFEQSYTSFVGTVKFYDNKHANFWYGFGLEILKLNSSEFTYNEVSSSAQTTVEEDVQKPIFAAVEGSIGYDYRLSKSFYVLPMFRAGVILNSDPVIIVGEVLLPVVYVF